MRKILLVGNPNVGKSVFFSRLTGVQVITSNYAGTTVEFTKGQTQIGGETAEIIDVPGTYTLEPTCKAEEVACAMLKECAGEGRREGDVVVNVVDATNLERNLYLTLELMEHGIPVVVALNMWDETKHLGITIDVKKLEDWLGVPVVPTVAVTGEGFKELVEKILAARVPAVRKHSRGERWADIGKVVAEIQVIEHRHHTWLDWLQDLSVHPVSGIPLALIIIYLAFKLTRLVAESFITYIADPFFDGIWAPLLMRLGDWLGAGFWHDILIGKLIGGQIDFVQSFGVLSTAVYVEFAMVLPYIFAFYLVLSILEDFGYLPRLAVLVDNIMHRIGLHGYAIIPTLLGLGCNVPGILATRILESRRERFIAATLISIGIPCAALQAMIVGVLGKYGGSTIATVYLTLFVVWIFLGLVLNRILPGFSPELLIEIPPYRLPPLKALAQKVWMRVWGFITEAAPVVLLGVLAVNILYMIGIFNFLSGLFAPVITTILGLPKEAAAAILIGFLRKDVAVGMLLPLNLSVKQLIIGCTVLSMFFPCIATFIILARELGWKDMLKSTAIMIVVALIVGGVLNLVL
jgi:ferrous iron transport protein B